MAATLAAPFPGEGGAGGECLLHDARPVSPSRFSRDSGSCLPAAAQSPRLPLRRVPARGEGGPALCPGLSPPGAVAALLSGDPVNLLI